MIDETGFASVPVPGWRHPHLLDVRTRKTKLLGHQDGVVIKPFTGHEPEPVLPKGWDMVREGEDWRPVTQRQKEIGFVHDEWAKAAFEVKVGALLKQVDRYGGSPAAQVWEQFEQARDALTAAYAALRATPDGMWRAALVRIVEAKATARAAAKSWDSVAEQFARLDEQLLDAVGEEQYPGNAIGLAAAKHGVDVSGWLFGGVSDYRRSSWTSPTAARLVELKVEAGDALIAAVQEYTGVEEYSE
jgi:hypothetical protein